MSRARLCATFGKFHNPSGTEGGDYEVRARLDHETSVTTDSVGHGTPCELLNVIVHGEPEVASLSIINAAKDENCD
jgi:hypothetical protein